MNASADTMTPDRGRAGQFDVLRAIDRAVHRRVLVYGSLPPHARDLDLVAQVDDYDAIGGALRGMECLNRGRQWVVFHDCAVTVVDVIPAATLALAAEEEGALFADATPLDRLSRVVEPSPHHALLILARRLERARGLSEKHRARIDRALARDHTAWEEARARAGTWQAGDALAHLEELYLRAHEQPVGRRFPRRPRRIRTIALSGADSERVRFHARALRDALERLGYDAVVERPRPVARVHGPHGRPRRAGGWSAEANRVGWTAAAGELWWRSATLALRGRVVVYERHALDHAVALGGDAADARLMRFLAPRPLRTYLLDVPDDPSQPRTAAYRRAASVFGARRLDSERPESELCREIFADVWSALDRRARPMSAVSGALRRVRSGRRS